MNKLVGNSPTEDGESEPLMKKDEKKDEEVTGETVWWTVIDKNPTNQHKIVFLEDELRWHCARCNKIGGTFFSFERAPKSKSARSGDVNHTPTPKLFDEKIFKALNTACEHHKLPERKL